MHWIFPVGRKVTHTDTVIIIVSRPLAGCGKTYLLMRSLSAPCDKAGFPFLSSPPLGEITERESRLRKAFFRSLLVS